MKNGKKNLVLGVIIGIILAFFYFCLLYTSDAADE